MSNLDVLEDTDVLVEDQTDLEPPPLFKVIILNDDFTPQMFVVEILLYVFQKTPQDAIDITLSVHNNGSGVVAVYPEDIAKAKIKTATKLSEEAEFPLKFIMEKDTHRPSKSFKV